MASGTRLAPPRLASMHIYVILNERAGSILGQDRGAVQKTVTTAFEKAGHDVLVEFAPPKQLTSKIEAASKRSFDVIVVGGGDGTVRSAAAIAIANDVAIGVLPLGTLNRLARDLSIPLSLEQAATALAAGETQRIDAASVNGKFYLCNSLIGLPPSYSEQRQKLRGQSLGRRLHGYQSVIRAMLSSRKRMTIAVDDGHEQRTMRALSVAVSNNAYDETMTLGLTRPVLNNGKLAVYVSRHRSGWAMVRAVGRAVLGFWKGDPYLQKFLAEELVIRLTRSHVRVSNDGEVETFTTPLHYKIHPGALRVLMPKRQKADPVISDSPTVASVAAQ